MFHCEDCGAEFERALTLGTGRQMRIYCPECKGSYVLMVMPGMCQTYTKKFKITVEEIKDSE